MAAGTRTTDGHGATGRAAGPITVGMCAVLLGAAVGIIGVMCVVGSLLLVHGAVPSWVARGDVSVSTWAVAHRTPELDAATNVGSSMADTLIALAVTAAAIGILRVWLGRWRESLVLVVAVVGELLIFLVITAAVHRTRPDVPKLDDAPPRSSFPSGHTGLAVALYGCLALILLRNVTPRAIAVGLAVLGGCIPVIVAASRVYRGMHYPTDVVFGAIAAGSWLTVVLLVLLPRARSRPTRSDPLMQ